MSQYRFVETIRIINRRAENLLYHQQRLNRTFSMFYIQGRPHNLRKIFSSFAVASPGLFKARFLYNDKDFSLEISLYRPKPIICLKLVRCDNIDYSYKSVDRRIFAELLTRAGQCNEILIVKNGMVTDTSFSNIVFFDGKDWYTPSSYLLPGTYRQYLLETGRIKETTVREEDIDRYTHFKLINAMLAWDMNPMPVNNIFF